MHLSLSTQKQKIHMTSVFHGALSRQWYKQHWGSSNVQTNLIHVHLPKMSLQSQYEKWRNDLPIWCGLVQDICLSPIWRWWTIAGGSIGESSSSALYYTHKVRVRYEKKCVVVGDGELQIRLKLSALALSWSASSHQPSLLSSVLCVSSLFHLPLVTCNPSFVQGTFHPLLVCSLCFITPGPM